MKLCALSCVGFFCVVPLLAAPVDIEAALAQLKSFVEKKDPAQVKKLATEISLQSREAAAETAPDSAADKAAWQSRVGRAKDLDLYTEYALYATAVQAEPATLIDLLATLEQQNPRSKYLEDAYGPYFIALTKTGAAAKVPAVADKALGHWPNNSDILLVLADSAYQAKRYDRAATLGTRLSAAAGRKAKPEGVPAAEWDKKKAAILGHAYFIAGMSYYMQNDFFNTDRNLRPALPYIKGGDEATYANTLFCLGVADYNLGRQTLNKRMMLDGAGYSDQVAAMKSPLARQAWEQCAQDPGGSRTHAVAAGVQISARAMASASPSAVEGSASAEMVNPCRDAVSVVTGPIEAHLAPASASAPTAASRFFTVEPLVNVTQSGLLAAKTCRACCSSPGGAIVR